MKGILKTDSLTLVQKKKNEIDANSYYYNIAFTNGEEILMCTCGAKGDVLIIGKEYYAGFDYLDKKLKLVDFEEVKKPTNK